MANRHRQYGQDPLLAGADRDRGRREPQIALGDLAGCVLNPVGRVDVDDSPHRLAAHRRDGAAEAAAFVAGAFSPGASPGVRTAYIRTLLGTPDHVIVQSYAGMYADPDAVEVRPCSEAYLRRRPPRPALIVCTSAEAARWERGASL
ncbi:hypothetical protein AB0M61_16355 [Streptomyces sp. NPDC051642]|uniref:hypothetical protein n=1 Tax=Streptomyces sp. NPDC051642 TaxID=3154646 RepID=UPI003449248A